MVARALLPVPFPLRPGEPRRPFRHSREWLCHVPGRQREAGFRRVWLSRHSARVVIELSGGSLLLPSRQGTKCSSNDNLIRQFVNARFQKTYFDAGNVRRIARQNVYVLIVFIHILASFAIFFSFFCGRSLRGIFCRLRVCGKFATEGDCGDE